MNKKILMILGTRPEFLKLLPLWIELDKMHHHPIMFFTRQHGTLQNDPFIAACIRKMRTKDDKVDHVQFAYWDSGLTKADHTQVLSRIPEIMRTIVDNDPACVVVQGDTTSGLAGAMAAVYTKRFLVHLEAGMRSFDLYDPLPEEMNRVMIDSVSDLMLAPSWHAMQNLDFRNERFESDGSVRHVGNTSIDMVRMVTEPDPWFEGIVQKERFIPFPGKDIVLVTIHRKETVGDEFIDSRLGEILHALDVVAAEMENVIFLWPVHPNPRILDAVKSIGSGNIKCILPLPYPELLDVVRKSRFVITDSGGIQEECCALGKRIVVVRKRTERPEVQECGVGLLVPPSFQKIVEAVRQVNEFSVTPLPKVEPYGTGYSAVTAAAIIENMLLGR